MCYRADWFGIIAGYNSQISTHIPCQQNSLLFFAYENCLFYRSVCSVNVYINCGESVNCRAVCGNNSVLGRGACVANFYFYLFLKVKSCNSSFCSRIRCRLSCGDEAIISVVVDVHFDVWSAPLLLLPPTHPAPESGSCPLTL